ncbi:MAG: AraC family transcriptional regulator [Paludibacter sp.]|jgi:AraC-like DNA-binding protein|nr:AraC family transcriptional regulator [Paludibacter sp.]
MIRQKEGFKGQRLIAISPEIVKTSQLNTLTNSLYITKIGFFPSVKYHYNNKEKGVDYYIIIYCTAGEGWYKLGEKTYSVTENQYIILPPETPYSFGANASNPWTIYWVHYKGKLAPSFFHPSIIPINIEANQNSRLQDRIQLFEEIYENLELSFQSNHYNYASLCLFHFLASFKYVDQFRQIRKKEVKEFRFSEKVIYYMRENIENTISLEQMARHFNFSPSHFSALFHEETKMSPIKYFISLKIEKACQYLELSHMKICDIHLKLGFQDAAYFSRIFSKMMGISPSKYRVREMHINKL